MNMLRVLVTLFVAGLSLAARTAEPRPFELGIIPYLPTAKLIDTYQPLRAHLEAGLQRPVVISTAPDFKTFLDRSLRREYDMVVIGPGLGRLVQVDAGYAPLLASRRNIKALIVVRRDAPHAKLKDLADRRIAMIDTMTGLSQLGQETLRLSGMLPERDYKLLIVNSPSNALQSVLHDEADAGVTTTNLIPQLDEETKGRLRILAESREISGLWFMLKKNAGPDPIRMRAMLLGFEKTDAGRQFIGSLALDGLRPLVESEMKAMDSFLPELRKR
jgi:phosphonate transport system substrate-binding protein